MGKNLISISVFFFNRLVPDAHFFFKYGSETRCSVMDHDFQNYVLFMVLILDGNSVIGAHVRSNLCYLICVRRLIRS